MTATRHTGQEILLFLPKIDFGKLRTRSKHGRGGRPGNDPGVKTEEKGAAAGGLWKTKDKETRLPRRLRLTLGSGERNGYNLAGNDRRGYIFSRSSRLTSIDCLDCILSSRLVREKLPLCVFER